MLMDRMIYLVYVCCSSRSTKYSVLVHKHWYFYRGSPEIITNEERALDVDVRTGVHVINNTPYVATLS